MDGRWKDEGDRFEGKTCWNQTGIRRWGVNGRNHAAAKRAARWQVCRPLTTARKLYGAIAGTDDVAESVELHGVRGRAESKRAERRLEQQHTGRDKRSRHAPSLTPDVQNLPLHAATADT